MPAFAQISGRLGQDPNLNFTHGGTPVVNLSVANNRRVKEGEEKKYIADWYKVTLFGRDAEIIAEHAKKGSALSFNGRLQTEHYEDREGVQRSTVVLVANSFEFVPGRKQEGAQNEGGGAGHSAREIQAEKADEGEENDIPF